MTEDFDYEEWGNIKLAIPDEELFGTNWAKKARYAEWLQSPEGRESTRASVARHRQTEVGRKAAREKRAAYAKTEKGKATAARASKALRERRKAEKGPQK